MAYQLKVVQGIAEGRSFTVSADELTIGRVESNTLVVFDPGVSRQHAVIRKVAGRMKVVDLGSRNGTFLNGAPVVEEFIDDGDLLAIGPATFRYSTGGGAAGPRLHEMSTQIIGQRPAPAPKPAAAGSTGAKKTAGAGTGSLKKALIIALAGVLAIAAVVSVYSLVSGGSLVTRDRSSETFQIGVANYGKKFGHGEVDIECAKSCSFSFPYSDGRAVLGYAAGMIADREEVEIILNGRVVGHAPQTGDGWMRGLGIPLPGDAMRPGALNVVTFSNRLNPGAGARWAVSFVKVTEESLPAPNADKARELAEMGDKKYSEKEIAPGNLYQALVYLRSSKDYMEKMEPRPGLYYEVSRKIETVSKELQEQFDKLMFTARKAMQFSDRGRAAEALEKVLKVFPDAEDQRHQEARQLLDGLR